MAGKKCRSCGAPIEWATISDTGRRIPLDEGTFPAPAGNLVLLCGVARFATKEEKGPFRRSHFVSCPQADMWRKRR